MPTAYVQQPVCRFLNFIRFLLFADLVTTNTLWLVAGDSDYLTNNVTHFKIEHSVFDLAVMRSVAACILMILYTALEGNAMRRVSSDENGEFRNKSKKIWFIPTFLLTAGSLAYSIAKFVLMDKNDRDKVHMSYYALSIASIAFSSVEFIIFFANIFMLKKLAIRYSRMSANGKVELDEESQEPGEKKKKASLGRLFGLAKPEAGILLCGTIGLAVSSGSNMVAPLFFGKVIDAALKPTMGPLNHTILLLFIIYTLGGIAAFFRTWFYTLAGQRLVARLRRELFAHIMSQEVGFFDSTRTGELMNRLSSDSQVIQNAVTVNISMLARYILQIVGSLAIMFVVSPKLTAVLLAVVPLVAICASRYGTYMRDLTKKFQDKLADASTSSEESIGNVRTVKAFSQERKASVFYAKDINESYSIGATLAFASGIFQAGMSIFAQGAVVLVLWYGGKLVHDGGMSLGTLTAFMLYTLNVAMAFAFLSSLYGDFMKAVGASVRIFELFDRVPKIKSGEASLQSLEGVEIKFDDVSFRYPSRPDTNVLQDLSFCIKPGETVALVGPSGGGKSTIIGMIERFYDPEKGTISLGNTNLPQVDLDWFRKKIGIVNQEPVLFATTIAENIAYGKDASEEEIIDAAKQANAHRFISEFEDGYQTTVGERGIKLSGGQKQRVAIARALLLNPEILLLDEATSALDAESEHLVKEAIDRAMVGRTVLVIAHRLSTVRNASRVLVIDKGQIVEQGTHEQLIKLEGTYKKLVLRQLNFGGDGAGSMTSTPLHTPPGSPDLRRKVLTAEAGKESGDDSPTIAPDA